MAFGTRLDSIPAEASYLPSPDAGAHPGVGRSVSDLTTA